MEYNSNPYPIFNILKMKKLGGSSFDSSFSRSVRSTAGLIEDDTRRYSVSQTFYADDSQSIPAVAINDGRIIAKEYSTKQSQRLPPWALVLIMHSLGLHETKRPVLGTFIHVVTFSTALLFIVSYLWISTYNVMSPKTPLNILNGSVSILIATIWSALGMYAKSLCKRLFRHRRLVQDIRMHSRTMFKLNVALLAFLMGLLFVIVSDIDGMAYLDPQTCDDIFLPHFVCCLHFGSRVVFSVISLVWNTLVAIVLVSLCRTHTIGVRRFIKELELDALTYDNVHCKLFKECPMTKEDVFEETFWLEEEQNLGVESDFIVISERRKIGNVADASPDSGRGSARQEGLSPDDSLTTPRRSPNLSVKKLRFEIQNDRVLNADDTTEISNMVSELEIRKDSNPDEIVSDFRDVVDEGCSEETQRVTDKGRNILNCQPSCSSIPEEDELEKTTETGFQSPEQTFAHMSSPEILHKYWKISCRLRATSCVFQRWLASLITLVIVWCIVYLLYWQDHSASIHDVVLFVLPLMLLPLLCSAFAEVNMEGVRMVKCICPTEERLSLLRFLQQNPLQMTVFNVCLSYGTIMTVVFAIFVAFTSRLIFTELQQN